MTLLRTAIWGLDARPTCTFWTLEKERSSPRGFNVYPPEVEAAITITPQVISSAVVGRSHRQ